MEDRATSHPPFGRREIGTIGAVWLVQVTGHALIPFLGLPSCSRDSLIGCTWQSIGSPVVRSPHSDRATLSSSGSMTRYRCDEATVITLGCKKRSVIAAPTEL